MTFEIELDGKRREVSIEPAGHGRFRVVVLSSEAPEGSAGTAPPSAKNEARIVAAERTSEFGLALTLDERSGTSREITVTPGSNGEFLVGLEGRTIPVAVDGRRRRARGDGGRHAAGEQAVAAPMPGRIVRVLVGVGDEVRPRQGVVVVEAMKMENELRSPKAGRIKEVTVAPGTLVEAGRVLVVVE
jgi:biotin carboxyl carrier protein